MSLLEKKSIIIMIHDQRLNLLGGGGGGGRGILGGSITSFVDVYHDLERKSRSLTSFYTHVLFFIIL